MNTLFILLAQAESADKAPASMLEQLLGGPFLMIGVLFLMMYFLLIRPQKKQRKELEERVASMEKGDKVITVGGVHSIVHHISDKTVTLKLAEGIFVPFEKSSIQSVLKKKGSSDSSDKDDSSDKK